MFFSRTNKGETSSLIAFIESGTVRMGIVLRSPDDLPTLVYETARPFKAATEPDRLVTAMIGALSECCADVTKDALPHIVSRRRAVRGIFDSIRFVYGAPWYISRGRLITVENAVPVAYTPATLDALIEEHSADIIPEPYKDAVCIERFATNWKINGYEISDPTGKPGTRLSFNLFASGVPAGVKNSVEETLARSFHAHTISHHSISFIASLALTDTGKEESPSLFVHISEHVTEIALIAGDVILDSITFPEGTSHFHAAWSAATGRLPHEASAHSKRPLGNIDVTDSWRAGIGECLGALTTAQHLPGHVIVLGEPAIRQRAFDAIRDISGAVFGRSLSGSMLTEVSLNAFLRVAAGATPGSPAMRMAAVTG